MSSSDDTAEAGSVGGETGGGDAGASSAPAQAADPAPRAPKVGGATLFERMANLSRGGRSSSDEEDEDEDGEGGGPSLSIPRFLGRQNNQ